MTPLEPYDAVLLLSFGGPERLEDVRPFLENVTRGRDIPPARLREVAAHYEARNGRSPINDENRALIAAIETELARRAAPVPVLWGNRNFAPYLADALEDAHRRGLRRLLAVFTSAYSSYSSCRQYRENLADAVTGAGLVAGRDVVIDKLAPYALEPAFIGPMIRLAAEGLREVLTRPGVDPDRVRLVFVTHSVPTAMNLASGPPGDGRAYERQHRRVADLVASGVAERTGHEVRWRLAYCSRSGPPQVPWLEPDIGDVLESLGGEGADGVVVVPIGFVADHMEVVHDLDTEAAARAAEAGLEMVRVPTVRADPEFVSGLVDLAERRAAQARGRSPESSPSALRPPAVCPAGCCRAPREPRPALCGADADGNGRAVDQARRAHEWR